MSVQPLSCALQQYAWGKIGNESTVAKFGAAAMPGFEVDPESPYAELWMGTHPNGPCILQKGDSSLLSYIEKHPEVLGDKVKERFDGKLPFLFKVLSVGKSLSIQAHPDLDLAKKLHADRPDIYKDPNHKPEICIALTPFEALCGFRPLAEIAAYAKTIKPLRNLLGDDLADGLNDKEGLKAAFSKLMNAPKDILAVELACLMSLLEGQKESDDTSKLALRLAKQFPGDVGCFSVYFLNFVKLKVGEGLFLGPNEAHAYLAGDCIECMAASDNVIRAGLTPKFIDVPVLLEMLTYSSGPGEDKILRAKSGDSTVHNAPVDEFDVEKITIINEEHKELAPKNGPSIIIAVSAEDKNATLSGYPVAAGSVFFIPAGETLVLSGSMEIYRAYCEL